MAKGKKGNKGSNQNSNTSSNVQANAKTAEEQASKQEQMTKIMSALQTMDLDNEDFIDVKSFDQSRKILENAIEALEGDLKLFEKEEYEKLAKHASVAN